MIESDFFSVVRAVGLKFQKLPRNRQMQIRWAGAKAVRALGLLHGAKMGPNL